MKCDRRVTARLASAAGSMINWRRGGREWRSGPEVDVDVWREYGNPCAGDT